MGRTMVATLALSNLQAKAEGDRGSLVLYIKGQLTPGTNHPASWLSKNISDVSSLECPARTYTNAQCAWRLPLIPGAPEAGLTGYLGYSPV